MRGDGIEIATFVKLKALVNLARIFGINVAPEPKHPRPGYERAATALHRRISCRFQQRARSHAWVIPNATSRAGSAPVAPMRDRHRNREGQRGGAAQRGALLIMCLGICGHRLGAICVTWSIGVVPTCHGAPRTKSALGKRAPSPTSCRRAAVGRADESVCTTRRWHSTRWRGLSVSRRTLAWAEKSRAQSRRGGRCIARKAAAPYTRRELTRKWGRCCRNAVTCKQRR